MATQCAAWRVKDDQMFHFINGPKIHFPLRCEGKAIQGDKVCGKCAKKRNKPKPDKNIGNHPPIWWGTIDEAVKDFGALKSRMWGSQWFYEKVKAGNTISPEDMGRVKKAVQGTAMEVLSNAPLPEPPATVPTEKKKRVPKAKKEPEAKKAEVTQPVAVVQEEPIEPEEVHVVQVIKKELNGKQYYYDSGKKKLYEPSTGKYVGRWDSVKELVITSIPDSDAE